MLLRFVRSAAALELVEFIASTLAQLDALVSAATLVAASSLRELRTGDWVRLGSRQLREGPGAFSSARPHEGRAQQLVNRPRKERNASAMSPFWMRTRSMARL
jgi:hypothetical protein